jgi:hypothetical protein
VVSDSRENSQAIPSSGGRPNDYVIVIAASDWVKERYPAAGANLYDALQTGKDRHCEPEIDLEAES